MSVQHIRPLSLLESQQAGSPGPVPPLPGPFCSGEAPGADMWSERPGSLPSTLQWASGLCSPHTAGSLLSIYTPQKLIHRNFPKPET